MPGNYLQLHLSENGQGNLSGEGMEEGPGRPCHGEAIGKLKTWSPKDLQSLDTFTLSTVPSR